MEKVIKIKRGLDIPLYGSPTADVTEDRRTREYAITPDDYPGMVWKARVKAGDKVKAGSTLLSDKDTGVVCLTSPVSGEVTEVARGERRKILYVAVREEGSEREKFEPGTTPESIRKALQASGLWAMMRQRPFDIVPSADVKARDIYVTAFDTAPLAGPVLIGDEGKWLEKGLEALSKLTEGHVMLGVRSGSGIDSKVAETTEYEGPHPAGNVGTQIAATRPVNKGETVLTLDAATAVRIGKLMETGELDSTAHVALTGSEMKHPHIVTTRLGAKLSTLLEGELKDGKEHMRVISGNVLTGVKCALKSGFLRYPYRQVTVIEEGDDADEFMGWASMSPEKYSVKRTFPAWLRGLSKPFRFDARVKGGHRAMILSEEYDKVFPFDIYPEYLLKAFMANDIDRMEQLGAYEVAPEDFALAEFVDTSKQPLQQIVRDGLENMRKELS